MTKEDTLKEERQESFHRLEASHSRSLYRPSFKERLINNFPFPKSRLYVTTMRWCGIKIGKGVQVLGRLKVKVRGKFENISIGDNVVLAKNVDLRNRENGKIIIHDRVYLDSDVRLVAAREGGIEIGTGTELGANTIINSGGVTKIGKHVLFAGFINVNSSSHGVEKNRYIKDQPHEHGTVTIGDDVWIGSYAAILMNSTIGEGAIVGSHSVVRGDIPDFGVAVGVPAKVIKYRS